MKVDSLVEGAGLLTVSLTITCVLGCACFFRVAFHETFCQITDASVIIPTETNPQISDEKIIKIQVCMHLSFWPCTNEL